MGEFVGILNDEQEDRLIALLAHRLWGIEALDQAGIAAVKAGFARDKAVDVEVIAGAIGAYAARVTGRVVSADEHASRARAANRVFRQFLTEQPANGTTWTGKHCPSNPGPKS